MNFTNKVYAYITRGDQLLIFSHPNHPEAGLQIPGGTHEKGETWEAGVLREAWEETGLMKLELVRFLGEDTYPRGELMLRRRFFHLTTNEPTPDVWDREEAFASTGETPLFRLFWVDLDDVPPLIARMDAFLPLLLTQPVTNSTADNEERNE